MEFSYIIAYRHSEERYKNIQLVLNWISDSAKEIILVESDIDSKLQNLKDKFEFNHIFLKNNYPFNKSWCFNVGFKKATTPNIVFGDADLIMDKYKFLESVGFLKDFEVVNPYKPVLDLTYEESELYSQSENFEILKNINRPGRGETDHQKVPFCGGIIMFRKSTLEKIGGWNEDFWGWGCEDDAQSFKVFTLDLNHLQCENKCYHLYHMRPAPNQELYFRNFNIYRHFVQTDKLSLENHIERTRGTIGNPKKIETLSE